MSEQGDFRPPDMPDVFVSHSHKDADVVRRLVGILKDAGITTYFSTEDQRPGTKRFQPEITQKHRWCYLVLGVQSRNALASEWTQKEWARAQKHDKLMFAKIENFDDDEVELQYDGIQYAKLWDWDGSPSNVECKNLIEVISDRVKNGKEAAAENKGDEVAKAPPPKAAREKISIGAGYGAPVPLAPALPVAPSPPAADEEPIAPAGPALDLGLTPQDWSVANLAQIVEKALKAANAEQLRRGARSGQPDAQAVLGFAQLLGLGGLTRDEGAASRWMEKASAGQPRAKAELAYMMAAGRLGRGNFERMDTLSCEAAASVNARAKTLRALIRLSGIRLRGVSLTDTTRLLELASNAGDMLAAGHLGWSLLHGRGVRRDPARAYDLLRNASQAGEPRAMAYFGMVHAFGRGAPRDPRKAAHWFLESARRGDAWGEFYSGWASEIGVGVARDAGEARRWYRKAALQGDADAQLRLGRMLLDGRGGVADAAEAAKLLEAAATAGEETAAALLGQMYEEGRGVPRDIQKAFKLYETAADDDEPLALWRLGLLYENGRGVDRNIDHAKDLFRRAAFAAPDKTFFIMVLQRLDHYGASLKLPPKPS